FCRAKAGKVSKPERIEFHVNHKSHRSQPKVRCRIRRVMCILLALYVIACVGCAAFQRRMLYYPTIESPVALERLAADRGFERWKNSTGRNMGWKRMAANQPARGRVLVTHGNGGCSIDRVDFAKALSGFLAMDAFILEYPGFGDRPGVPSQRSLFESADDAFQDLPKIGPVYLLGESLGTGVAAHLAGMHSNEVSGVLLFAPYNSLVDVAQYHVRILPARWLMVDYFPSAEYLSHYRGPLAIVVGGKDRVVPEKFGRRLFDGYAGPKRLWKIPLGNHQSIDHQSAEFWNEVGAFWKGDPAHAPPFP
ncbi:MAG: alpha/beta hydrolase, partial [Verrucomicrobiota bacterium]